MDPRIEDLTLFKGFAQSEISQIRSCLVEKKFAKGQALFLEGNECQKVFFVRDGRVKLYRTASSGREQILESLGPGDTCACHPGAEKWSCVATAEAITACTVWYLSRKDYAQLVHANHKLANTLNLLFAEKLKRFSCLIEDVSLHDVRKRLVKFLLDMLNNSEGKKNGQQNVLNVPFTREEIAQRLGTSRETVARYLHDLKRDRMIDINAQQIVILNKTKLNDLVT